MIFNMQSGKSKDENLIPENIKNGVEIDGVIGSFAGNVIFTDIGSVSSNTRQITLNNPFGTSLNGAVAINKGVSNNTISAIGVMKASNGTYYAWAHIYDAYGGRAGTHATGSTLADFGRNSNVKLSVTESTIVFTYNDGSVGQYFNGQYVGLVW